MATRTGRRPIASLRRDQAAPWRHIDWVLLAAVGCVAVLGLLMVFSATRGARPPYHYSLAAKQLLFIVLGAIAGGVVALIDYHHLRDWAVFIYIGAMLMLLAVLSPLGSNIKGHQGWFDLGMFQLQPSELAKVAMIVSIGALAAQFRGELDVRRIIVLLVAAGIPVGLVLLQGDLGTTLVFVAIVPTVLWVAGARPRHLAVLAVAGIIVATGVLTSGALHQYQKDRFTVFLTQDSNPATTQSQKGAGYNLDQAKITIGHGGLFGQGLFGGSQTRTGQVPEQQTDFIFTAVGEQFGFVGTGMLLALYGLIILRIWRTAQLARDDFGTYVCIGVLAMLVFQIFENSGMNMGIMPIAGIPLPFLSYGGSSTIANFMAIGLVLNIGSRRFA
jgi:rod shape determining protein RodA